MMAMNPSRIQRPILRPVFVAGRGARVADARADLERLADACGADAQGKRLHRARGAGHRASGPAAGRGSELGEEFGLRRCGESGGSLRFRRPDECVASAERQQG